MSSTKYVLLASVFHQRQEDGNRKRFRTGDIITGLSDDDAERLLKAKAIALPGDVASAPDLESPGGSAETADEKPGEDANKPELVAWLYENVAKEDGSDYTKTELNKMSPDELRAIVDSVED